MTVKILETLSRKIDTTAPPLLDLDAYYAGAQPLSFLSADARDALGNRLRALVTNYPRLTVDSLAERLTVVGFRTDGQPNDQIWHAWEDAGFEDGHHVVHTEALALGQSYVTVWGANGVPTLSVESPHEMACLRDPVTRQVTAAAKRWREDNRGRAVLFLPDKVHEYVSSAAVPEGGAIPPEGWQHVRATPNPLGEVPVVPFINRGRLLDLDGVSEMAGVMDLTDAISKLLADLMVSSEFFARPRRWVTGLEVQERPFLDKEGQPTFDQNGDPEMVAVNPFGDEAKRVWQTENPDAKFGQFAAANLSGYGDAINVMIQAISAVSGLPAHFLGIHADQPASADAIRSAESSLVARAQARMRSFGPSWAKVATLVSSVENGRPASRVETIWADPSTRTVAQEADAVTKLHGEGILPTEEAQARLGYTPEQIANMRGMRTREVLDRTALG